MRVVFTSGCWDLFHEGHRSILKRASEFGDHLIVGVNSDASVRRLKGKERPFDDEMTRARNVLSLYCVKTVSIFDEDTPIGLIRTFWPDVIVHGDDNPDETAVVGYGLAQIVILPRLPGVSTTLLLANRNTA